jgi:hypothetical protein
MKMVKSLILGSAAGLVVLGGAQAADLPVKAKAVEYVKICSLYGAGFYYIPGTDTCIKLSANASLAGTRYGNSFTWRSREDLDVDTRTATEYGVVRTFFDATFNWTTDAYAGAGTGASVYGAGAPGNGSSGNVALGGVGVYYAFIQFAGFTIGKAISQFSAPWTNYPGNNFDGLVGGGGTVTALAPARWGLSAPVTMVARLPPISSACSVSTRPGVCSRLRSRRMTTIPPITVQRH